MINKQIFHSHLIGGAVNKFHFKRVILYVFVVTRQRG